MPNELAPFADNSQLARNKTPPLGITKRIREAVDLMVERGLHYQAAAVECGIATRHMRLALSKPHVIAYHQQQLKVLRGARSSKNFHRLCEIADADNNMPAVNAIKALEGLELEQTNNKQTTSPGVSIRIVNVTAQPVHEQTTKIPTAYLETETNNNINAAHVITDNET